MDEPAGPPPLEERRDPLARVERVVVVTLFLVMTAVGTVQVLNRHGLNLPVWNLEQLLPHIFIGITFLGMSLTFRYRGHLAVEIVPQSLPARWRRGYDLFLWLTTAGFLAVLAYAAFEVLLFQIEIKAKTNMGYPAAILTACIVVGAVSSIWRIWQIEIRPLIERGR